MHGEGFTTQGSVSNLDRGTVAEGTVLSPEALQGTVVDGIEEVVVMNRAWEFNQVYFMGR
jgi:hypothetical protein